MCSNAVRVSQINRILDEEYLNLMLDPDSNIFQGDEFKTEVDAAFGPMTVSKDEVDVSKDDAESSTMMTTPHNVEDAMLVQQHIAVREHRQCCLLLLWGPAIDLLRGARRIDNSLT